MTSASAVIAAENKRRHIPVDWQVAFEEMTNRELADMSADDVNVSLKVRAFCAWELEFREASGVEVYYDAEKDRIGRKRS